MVRRCPSCAALKLKRGPKRTYPLTVFALIYERENKPCFSS
jgi:hypothetical protein